MFSFFKRKEPLKEDPEEEKECVAITSPGAPFTPQTPTIYALGYTQAPVLVSLREKLDAHLEKLFLGDIDEENGDVLDNLIADSCRQAVSNLVDQYNGHLRVINSIYTAREAWYKAFQDNLALNEKKEAKLARELEDVERRFRIDEFQEVDSDENTVQTDE